MRTLNRIAWDLAADLLAGVWTREELYRRVNRHLGGRAHKAKYFLVLYILTHAPDYPPSHRRLAWLLMQLDYLERAAADLIRSDAPIRPACEPPAFSPAEGCRGLDVPQITQAAELGEWLGLSAPHLLWLADERKRHGRTDDPVLQNYKYSFLAKRSGGFRLVEAPKTRLKAAQRKILHDILDRVPTHEAAHGFVRGRSCLTAAHLHAGERVVLGMDVADFFPSTPAGRVRILFRKIGYPHGVARLLTGLCTTMTPDNAFARAPVSAVFDWATRKRLGAPHLPQGAPTSPALANIVAQGLDARLSGLARRSSATYTRYADDLSFSGGEAFEAALGWFPQAVAGILRDEGWRANDRKTRIMRQSGAQVVTGLVVNQHINAPRETYEALKATLFNCLRYGAASQNRDDRPDFRAHLDGRVAWMAGVNPVRGRKLRALFDSIDWAA